MYAASVLSQCCKSRSDVAHVAMGLTYCSRLLQLLGHRACAWKVEGWSAAWCGVMGVLEVEGDDGRGTGSPRLCVQQGAGAGGPPYACNQLTL
jgi:hypothetical protein